MSLRCDLRLVTCFYKYLSTYWDRLLVNEPIPANDRSTWRVGEGFVDFRKVVEDGGNGFSNG